MIFDRLAHIKLEIENRKIISLNEKAFKENERQNKMIEVYNIASASLGDAVVLFNRFIDYRNKQFTPLKSDAQIQTMIDTATNSILSANATLSKISDPPGQIVPMMSKLHTAIDDALKQIEEQRKWLKDYFSKPEIARKMAFYTRL
jgi:hypothetical protein